MTREAAALPEIVAPPRLLLRPVDDQHGGIDVEDQPGTRVRLHHHPAQEPIVQRPEPREGARRHPEQEVTEPGGVRVPQEPRGVLENAVYPEHLRRLEPLKAEDDGVQQGQQHLAHAVPVVALGQAEFPGEPLAQVEPIEEPMEEVGAGVVSQRARPEGYGRGGAFDDLRIYGPQRS